MAEICIALVAAVLVATVFGTAARAAEAICADESGDVAVVGSTIDGSDADGPGGAIFTPDGDAPADRVQRGRRWREHR